MHRAVRSHRGVGVHRRRPSVLLWLALTTLGNSIATSSQAAGTSYEERWVGTWAAAPQPFMPGNLETFENQSVRLIVHISLGATKLRIKLSNRFGTEPLLLGAAHVARRSVGADIEPGSDRELTFAGLRTVSVPRGSSISSDPVDLEVKGLTDLAISFYLPRTTTATTSHFLALQENYVSANHEDVTGVTSFPVGKDSSTWPFLTGVDVIAQGGERAIVAFGDSTVDGDGSTSGENHRWPDLLATRLQVAGQPLGILNEGIIGNRLLRASPRSDREFGAAFGASGLARFDRDALAQPGVRWVIVRLGINDIGFPGAFAGAGKPVRVQSLIAGYRHLVAQAHERGIRMMGMTLTPFENATLATRFFTSEKEALRQAINSWIRTSHAFDAVVDLDALLRDPNRPERLLPLYDSGDHLHLNDAGYAVTANAIPLSWFR